MIGEVKYLADNQTRLFIFATVLRYNDWYGTCFNTLFKMTALSSKVVGHTEKHSMKMEIYAKLKFA